MAKRKKQALDNLLNTGRISQSTYESFNKEIDEAVVEIERQHRALLEKMNSKTEDLEKQIKTLEMLLANFEIQHVTGEIDEEVYQREIDVLSTGLEVARRELDAVKEAGNQLSSSIQILTTEIAEPHEIEPHPTESFEPPPQPEIEVAEETVPMAETEETVEPPSQVEIEVAEETVPTVEPEETVEETMEHNLPEPPVESIEVSETDSFQSQQETQETWPDTSESTEETQETSQDTDETESIETVAEGEEDEE
jgi:S-DNA-T family DNA segregation ATPase FtsK/SpoIIIE